MGTFLAFHSSNLKKHYNTFFCSSFGQKKQLNTFFLSSISHFLSFFKEEDIFLVFSKYFLDVCFSSEQPLVSDDALRLTIFTFSLQDSALDWLELVGITTQPLYSHLGGTPYKVSQQLFPSEKDVSFAR